MPRRTQRLRREDGCYRYRQIELEVPRDHQASFARRYKPRPPATPDTRERYRAAAKARWADPVVSEKIRAAIRDPTNRARMREESIARWADPAMRERMIAKMRASNADPALRQKKGAASKERWADPSMREKILTAMRTTTKHRRKRDISDH